MNNGEFSGNELPKDDDAFDAYVARFGFHAITEVAAMEQFLLRAAKRFHVLARLRSNAINADAELPRAQEEAWEFGHWNFGMEFSDLRMFFSETDDFELQTDAEKKRLFALADQLVGSAKDESRIVAAQCLNDSKVSANTPS